MSDETPETQAEMTNKNRLSRRAVVGTAAWSVPVISLATAAPAFAGSAQVLSRTTPASAAFSADQQAFSQTLTVTLTNGGNPVSGSTIMFAFGGGPAWLTFSANSVVTDGNGDATTTLQYGMPKPAAGSTFTISATLQSDPLVTTSWTLAYTPVALSNVAVVRVGTGAAALSNASTAVFIDTFAASATNAAAPATTITIPTAGTPLTVSGTATSEGYLSRSQNGSFLGLAGYAVAPGVSGIASTVSTTNQRGVARINSAGVVDASTTLGTAAFSAGNCRAAAFADNGDDIWVVGSNDGVRYAARGTATSTVVSGAVVNNRAIELSGGQLYFSNAAGTSPIPRGILQVGSSPPVGGTATNSLIVSDTSGLNEFVFLDRTETVAGADTIYIAEESGTGGIKKYCLVAGSWVARGNFVGSGSGGYRGLTGAVDPDGNVTLFATTVTGTVLVRIVDTSVYDAVMSASTATSTVVRTPATNTALRGVAFVPV